MSRVPQPVSEERSKTICMRGKGAACCRFLVVSESGLGCAKLTPMSYTINAHVGNMTAKGDNCPGIRAEHATLVGQRGTYTEDGESFDIEVIKDETDDEGLKFDVRIIGGTDAGREFSCFNAWDYGGMWTVRLGDGRALP